MSTCVWCHMKNAEEQVCGVPSLALIEQPFYPLRLCHWNTPWERSFAPSEKNRMSPRSAKASTLRNWRTFRRRYTSHFLMFYSKSVLKYFNHGQIVWDFTTMWMQKELCDLIARLMSLMASECWLIKRMASENWNFKSMFYTHKTEIKIKSLNSQIKYLVGLSLTCVSSLCCSQ